MDKSVAWGAVAASVVPGIKLIAPQIIAAAASFFHRLCIMFNPFLGNEDIVLNEQKSF